MPIPKLMFKKGLRVYRATMDTDDKHLLVQTFVVTKAGEQVGEVRRVAMRAGEEYISSPDGAQIGALLPRYELTQADAVRAFIVRNAEHRAQAVRVVEDTGRREKVAQAVLARVVTT